MSNTVAAAVVGSADSFVGTKPVLPFEAMMIPFDDEEEAHFVCGCLNSVVAQLIVVGSIVLHPDTHVLKRVRVPKFEQGNPVQTRIASVARSCQEAVAADRLGELDTLEAELNLACGRIWGVPRQEVEEIANCLAVMQGGVRRRPTRRRSPLPSAPVLRLPLEGDHQ